MCFLEVFVFLVADQGFFQTVGMRYEIHAETSLHAKASFIGLAVFAIAHDLNDFIILGIEIHLTADTAIGAGGADFIEFPGTAGKFRLLEGDGAGGTNLEHIRRRIHRMN